MKLIRGQHNLDQQPFLNGSVITIGNFDGLHLGHQQLINAVVMKAKQLKVPAILLTFEPHPREFFAGREVVPRLMRLREKYIGLMGSGIDYLCCLHFNKSLADLPAEDFVKNILLEQLHAKHVVVGDDFRFGAKRAGDYQALVEFAKQYQFSTEQLSTVLHQDQRISSSLVREALKADNLALVGAILNRPYSLCGRVVHGDKLGRKLGFPTANLYLHRQLVPVHGVYAVRIKGINNEVYYGAANVGTRPAVNGTRVLLEVYIFDFDQDIYGQQIQVEFLHKLREEKPYNSLEALTEAIKQD
ncbi:MAG: bifunctional riboflavin kinase/FAD synthetase, partial [Gammaproteobacteria bacterium]|nr:bifunctional riboflavin kinase/FAD synthetase [Gammaproteobacteria bacterium]